MTPHINANLGDFARAVIMPGDPLRAKFIAENFIDDAKLVNNVRNVCGYTGTYKGRPISVMGSGMGMPSISIYAKELYSQFGVDVIARAGSAGALSDQAPLRSVIICDHSITDGNIVKYHGATPCQPIPASSVLVRLAQDAAQRLNISHLTGTLYSSDIFYAPAGHNEEWGKHALAVEMESAALYALANQVGKKALAVCTVSDNALTGKGLSAAEREQSFSDMILIALETAISAI